MSPACQGHYACSPNPWGSPYLYEATVPLPGTAPVGFTDHDAEIARLVERLKGRIGAERLARLVASLDAAMEQ